jgi:sec-independent protein translocase protein TatB
MFGLGFTEILMIAVVALLFIGPDKLPDTMRNLARTLGKIKKAFDDTKSTIENELRVDDLRAEALSYKQQLQKAKDDLSAFKNVANKEVAEIKSAAQIEDSFKTSDINDDSDIFDEFDKAEQEFEDLESKKETHIKQPKPQKIEAAYRETKSELPEQEPILPEVEEESEAKSTTVNFKHLKPKDS